MLNDVFCDPGGRKKNDELPLMRMPTPVMEIGTGMSGPESIRSATRLFPELAVPNSAPQKFVWGSVMSIVRRIVSS